MTAERTFRIWRGDASGGEFREYRTEVAPVREEFFGKKSPASTMVGVTALAHPDWLIEVEAIAVI